MKDLPEVIMILHLPPSFLCRHCEWLGLFYSKSDPGINVSSSSGMNKNLAQPRG